MSISDRITDALPWDALTLEQWHALVEAMIRRRDHQAISDVLALMAVHGYPDEAEWLRLTMLATATLAEGGAE